MIEYDAEQEKIAANAGTESEKIYDKDDWEDNIVIKYENDEGKSTRDKIHRYWWQVMILIVICIIIILITSITRVVVLQKNANEVSPEVIQHVTKVVEDSQQSGFKELTMDSSRNSYVMVEDTTVMSIHLQILHIINSIPDLYVGNLDDLKSEGLVLGVRAADLGTNNQFVGSFIYDGQVLGRGSAKKGYCAIQGNSIALGFGDVNFYENLIENHGDLFRNYPLVVSGLPIDNRSYREEHFSICDYKNEIVVVHSLSKCTWTELAQTLAALNVTTAIALQGGYCLYKTKNNIYTTVKKNKYDDYSNTNYVVWRAGESNQ